MKTVALYLPQFHRIPENDIWWGEGFTEWTNVRKATPIYEGHRQPRLPLNENYYDLANPREIIHQMNLAKKYGIDGFCIYHYWFNGKKLLERPVEKMLEENELPIKFMLCWANEPWTRTWDGDEKAKVILQSQDYGDKEDWIRHYYYLNQFFMRDEYIKVDGRPVFCIYYARHFSRIQEMFSLWNQLAKENGFKKGLYFMNTHRLAVEREYPYYGDGVYDFEPFVSLLLSWEERDSISKEYVGFLDENRGMTYKVVNYERLCNLMVNRFVLSGSNHCLGFFTGWDNSPRRGIKPLLIVEGNTPDKVEYFFEKQYRRSLELNNEFLFINAWNEWGEGAILEPENGIGYAYLEGIKRTIYKYAN